MDKKQNRKYEDMLEMPRPISKKHPPMSTIDRAAQFAPFAALTGYKEAIHEQQRKTEQKKIVDEHKKALLNDTIIEIKNDLLHQPFLRVAYFKEDERKEGGAYITICERIKKIDTDQHVLVFIDYTKIPFDDIYEIEKVESTDI